MYGFSDKGLELQDQVKQFMDDFIYPNEEEYYAEYAALDNVHATPADDGEAQGRGPGAGSVEPVHPPSRSLRRPAPSCPTSTTPRSRRSWARCRSPPRP